MSAFRYGLAFLATFLAVLAAVQMVDKIAAGLTACASHEIACPAESLR